MAGVGALVLLGLFLREAFDLFIYLFILSQRRSDFKQKIIDFLGYRLCCLGAAAQVRLYSTRLTSVHRPTTRDAFFRLHGNSWRGEGGVPGRQSPCWRSQEAGRPPAWHRRAVGKHWLMVDDGDGVEKERGVCHLRRRVHSMYSVCARTVIARTAICAAVAGEGGQGLSGPLRYAPITVPGPLFKHLGPGGGGIPAPPRTRFHKRRAHRRGRAGRRTCWE